MPKAVYTFPIIFREDCNKPYGRDGKFRATVKSGTEKRLFFVATFDDLMSSNWSPEI